MSEVTNGAGGGVEDEAVSLDDMSYKELKALCKRDGLPTNGKTDALIARLMTRESLDTSPDPAAKVPVSAHKARDGELLFEAGDPFAAGALRSEGLSDILPCRLDTTEPYATDVLKNYVFRARGGCRNDLAGVVGKVLDKLCPGWDVKKNPAAAKAK